VYLLITVFLLAVVYYLSREGLAEKRWYEAHTDEATRESDEGLLGDWRNKIAPETTATGNSLEEDDSRLARHATRMQERTGKMGERLEQRVQSIRDKDEADTLFGKVADKVRNSNESNNAFNKVKVGAATDFADRKIEAQRNSSESEEELRNREKEGVFGRMVDMVSQKSEKLSARVEGKIQKARDQADKASGEFGEDDDLLTRVSAKVGGKVNELDDQMIDKSRNLIR